MILKVLYDYYQTLAADPESEISQTGYSKGKVNFSLLINKKGDLKDIIELKEGKKPILMDVPQHTIRTSGVSPYFLCDNPKYILGTEKENFEQSVKLHNNILKDVTDESAKAVLKYFEKWDSEQARKNELVKEHKESLEKGGNIVFTVEGIKGYIHEKAKIKKAWEKYLDSGSQKRIQGQCLVTGEEAELLEVHDSIKGVWNAQSSGAAIISFNKESFESYGKKQSINAPVSKAAAFAYVTTLNYMLNPTSMQNIQVGDATTVFWAETYGTGQEELLYALFSPTDVEEKKGTEEVSDKKTKDSKKEGKENKKTKLNDPRTISKMRDFLGRVASGKGLKDMPGYSPDVKFYVLGLSPNAARISVRFFYTDTFGKIVERIKQHYADLLTEKQYNNESEVIAVWQLLKETAAQGKSENVQPAFSGGLMRAILTGGIYPVAVYQAIVSRIGVDKNINRNRVAFIKAYLQRKDRINNKEGGVTMSLNNEERNAGYCLGRLFALLEKAQLDASPGINATIKDKYFGTASASPKAVFPFLIRLGQHHIAGAKYGKFTDKQIEEVMMMIGNEFPAHLSLDDQGRFMLGYYHQRNALYKKKEENK